MPRAFKSRGMRAKYSARKTRPGSAPRQPVSFAAPRGGWRGSGRRRPTDDSEIVTILQKGHTMTNSHAALTGVTSALERLGVRGNEIPAEPTHQLANGTPFIEVLTPAASDATSACREDRRPSTNEQGIPVDEDLKEP